MRFEWDPRKAEANRRTHSVSFAEAVTVLEEDFALTRDDPDAVDHENTVLEYFGNLVDEAGGGNHQTLMSDALLEYVHRRSTLDAVRQVVREELAPDGVLRSGRRLRRTRAARR